MGVLLAIFFTLNHSVIAGEKAMLLQGAVDIFVQVIERSCKGKGNSSGLAGDSAATYRYFYIILAVLFRNSKGEKGDVVLRFCFIILIDRLRSEERRVGKEW